MSKIHHTLIGVCVAAASLSVMAQAADEHGHLRRGERQQLLASRWFDSDVGNFQDAIGHQAGCQHDPRRDERRSGQRPRAQRRSAGSAPR